MKIIPEFFITLLKYISSYTINHRMKRLTSLIVLLVTTSLSSALIQAQKYATANPISESDLESHVSFLASPLLKGRLNGGEGLEIAGSYLAAQAKKAGLKPANNNSFFQPFTVIKKTTDYSKTSVKIISNGKDSVFCTEPFLNLVPTGPANFSLEGEVVFAGYGIKADKYSYNDFENIKPEGKILLILDRAPMNEEGNKLKFEEPAWNSEFNIQSKLTTLLLTKAKAILVVSDPKSGYNSLGESNPGIASYLEAKTALPGAKDEMANPFMSAMPKVLFIHRKMADELLKGTGFDLATLQKDIDNTMKSRSFPIENKKLIINAGISDSEMTLNNIAGYIEGSDPVLKNEVLVFSGHYDHIGASGEKVFTGADDDASGCAALLEMAEAFIGMKKPPRRTILFLWVAAEEIGLYGSESYTKAPLFPLEKTVADLNMDMIGRVKGVADTSDQNPMSGPNTVFVITDNQSSELLAIAKKADERNKIDFDYSLGGKDHPLQLFSRSDHYNFVKKDIPVLFFTTGLHTDYHTQGDVIGKIDFAKMELVTKTMFEIGLEVANRKTRLVVDNPFSSWTKKAK